jgi:putative protein-disulfide isomerase
MRELKNQFGDQIEFEVVSGGMITGARVGPVSQMASYIAEAYKTVERTTGEKFGIGFLDGVLKDGGQVLDSFPPAKALKIFKEFKPSLSMEFSRDIQRALYFNGEDLNKLETYLEILEGYDCSKEDFSILWRSPDYQVRTQEEFLFTQQLGVTGFPAVFLHAGSEYHQIAKGYTEYTVLEHRLIHVLQTVKSTRS